MRGRELLLSYILFLIQVPSSYGQVPCLPLVAPSPHSPIVFAMHVSKTSVIVRISQAHNRTDVHGYRIHVGEDWSCEVGAQNENKFCTRYGLRENESYALYSQTKFSSGYGKKEFQGYAKTVPLNMPELSMLTVTGNRVQLLLTPAWNQTGILGYNVRLGDQSFFHSRPWIGNYIWFYNLQPETWYPMVTQIETSDGLSDTFINGYVFTPPTTLPVIRQGWTESNYVRMMIGRAPNVNGVHEYAIALIGHSFVCTTRSVDSSDEADCMFNGVTAGTKYFVICRTRYASGWGEIYLCGFGYSLPDPPARLTAAIVGQGAIKAEIFPPNGNRDIVFYHLEKYYNDVVYVFNTSAGLSRTFTGLRPNTGYSFYAYSNVAGSHHGAENEEFASAYLRTGSW